MTDEDYHKQAIADIHRRAQQEAQPHLDALARIEAMKPPPRYFFASGDPDPIKDSLDRRYWPVTDDPPAPR